MWLWIDNPVDDRDVALQVLPSAMPREAAIAYTGLSPKVFRRAELDHRIRGLPIGRNGSIMFQTTDLHRFVEELFGDPPGGIEFNMDFAEVPAPKHPRKD